MAASTRPNPARWRPDCKSPTHRIPRSSFAAPPAPATALALPSKRASPNKPMSSVFSLTNSESSRPQRIFCHKSLEILPLTEIRMSALCPLSRLQVVTWHDETQKPCHSYRHRRANQRVPRPEDFGSDCAHPKVLCRVQFWQELDHCHDCQRHQHANYDRGASAFFPKHGQSQPSD